MVLRREDAKGGKTQQVARGRPSLGWEPVTGIHVEKYGVRDQKFCSNPLPSPVVLISIVYTGRVFVQLLIPVAFILQLPAIEINEIEIRILKYYGNFASFFKILYISVGSKGYCNYG
jgi:hypothetical protein